MGRGILCFNGRSAGLHLAKCTGNICLWTFPSRSSGRVACALSAGWKPAANQLTSSAAAKSLLDFLLRRLPGPGRAGLGNGFVAPVRCWQLPVSLCCASETSRRLGDAALRYSRMALVAAGLGEDLQEGTTGTRSSRVSGCVTHCRSKPMGSTDAPREGPVGFESALRYLVA